MTTFDSPESAADAVRAQSAAGYDMVKVYTRLDLDQLHAINRAAAEVGMPVIGHGSENYTLEQLVQSGQLNLAHGQELLRWYANEDVDEEELRAIVETVQPNALRDGLSGTGIRNDQEHALLEGNVRVRREIGRRH